MHVGGTHRESVVREAFKDMLKGKEKTPRNPTIREKFNTYRFADYKEQVIDLLTRATRVSVRTQDIMEAMRKEAAR